MIHLKRKVISSCFILLMSLSLIAGGTMSWFTDEDSAGEAEFTSGIVSIEAGGSMVLSQNFDPEGAAYLYGVEQTTGDLYEIDVKNGITHMFYDTDPIVFGSIDRWSPNGLAFDRGKRRLYMSVVKSSSKSDIWFYDLKEKELKKAGSVNQTVYGAAFGEGVYWYIANNTDDLWMVTFNDDGTLNNAKEYADIADNRFGFGDVVIDYQDGTLYGSSNGNNQFFKYDISTGTFETISTGSAADLQLAFGSDGILYGHKSGSSKNVKWYKIDKTDGSTTEIIIEGGQSFNDLACGYTSVWNPGDSEKMRYTIRNTGTKKIRVRAKFTGGWQNENGDPWNPPDGSENVVSISLCGEHSNDWRPEGGYYYYEGILEPEETVELCLKIELDGPGAGNEFMGKTFTLTGVMDAVQASNGAPQEVWGVDFLPSPSAESDSNQ